MFSRRGAARAEDAQGTPTQRHVPPSILEYEDYSDLDVDALKLEEIKVERIPATGVPRP